MRTISPGTLILGIFAVLFGLVGAYSAKQYLSSPPPVAATPRKNTTVPLAAADLVPGRTITLGDVMLVSMTPDEIKKKRLPPMFMVNPKQVIGRTLHEQVAKGDAFSTTAFYPEGMGPSITERLKPGYRAATVPLQNNASELSLASPGTMVDIVFRTSREALKDVPETTVNLLENVEVLAIGQEIFEGARPLRVGRPMESTPLASVTLAVTPQQANALKVVEGRGTMSLVARNPQDKTPAGPMEPQTLTSLLQLPEPKPAFTTEIYRRGALTTVKFDSGQRSVTHQDPDGFPVVSGAARTPVLPVSQSVAQAADAPTKSCSSCQSSARKSH